MISTFAYHFRLIWLSLLEIIRKSGWISGFETTNSNLVNIRKHVHWGPPVCHFHFFGNFRDSLGTVFSRYCVSFSRGGWIPRAVVLTRYWWRGAGVSQWSHGFCLVLVREPSYHLKHLIMKYNFIFKNINIAIQH